MFSYDGMIVAPIIIIISLRLFDKLRRIEIILYSALLLAYVLMRQHSGALVPSGDYGYNLAKLPINVIANSLTYFAAVFVGPQVIDRISMFRNVLRSQPAGIMYASIIGLFVIGISYYFIKKLIISMPAVISWLLITLVSMIAYLGLGGAAERYSIFAAFYIFLALGQFIQYLLKNKKNYSITLLVFALFSIFIVIINRQQYYEVSQDWKHASDVVESTLLKVKKQFFPLKDPTIFYVTNAPIRYGRAWIFPTGLNDAFWHMYRDADYSVIPAGSVDEALTKNPPPGKRIEILVFDSQMQLSKVSKEYIQPVKK
jgi:hypothetical protein